METILFLGFGLIVILFLCFKGCSFAMVNRKFSFGTGSAIAIHGHGNIVD
jgi:hypothetical protein